ncbi:MAG: SPOR domain-containing protein [Bacteroidaceae bacterium]
MKKILVLGISVCMTLAFVSCKSSESAYKKAYEKAKQHELVDSLQTSSTATEAATSVTAPYTVKKSVSNSTGIRQEKVTVVSGKDMLKKYSVVVGSFGVKANADGLKDWLDARGYDATVAFNAEKAMYRVIVNTFDDRSSAETARDEFKAKYSERADFQGSWLLYRLD